MYLNVCASQHSRLMWEQQKRVLRVEDAKMQWHACAYAHIDIQVCCAPFPKQSDDMFDSASAPRPHCACACKLVVHLSLSEVLSMTKA
jgi:hypothetical protein